MDIREISIKLGTFPVTQQVVGVAHFAYNLAMTIANIAKLIFYKIKESSGDNSITLYSKIVAAESDLKENAENILYGILTVIPVVGTLVNALIWKRMNQMRYAA